MTSTPTSTPQCFGLARFVLLSALAIPALAHAQLPVFYNRGEDVTAPYHPGGGTAEATFEISISEDPANPTFPTMTYTGFSMVFTVDPTVIEVVAITPAGPWQFICGSEWDYFASNLDTPGCPGMASVFAVYGFACDVTLPFEVETPMVAATVEALPGTFVGQTQNLTTLITGGTGCGTPPIVSAVPTGFGDVEPNWLDSTITFVPTPPVEFIRGDCNRDGSVQIADGIFLLNGLFLGGDFSDCPIACEVHADGNAPDIGDAIYLLQHLFVQGPPPAQPYPNCGVAPDSSPSDCILFPACP